MHHILTALFVLAVLLCLGARASATQPTKAEMNAAKTWLDANLGPAAASHPFSFIYNGRPSEEALKAWTTERTATNLDPNRTRRTITYSDPATGLILRCEAIELQRQRRGRVTRGNDDTDLDGHGVARSSHGEDAYHPHGNLRGAARLGAVRQRVVVTGGPFTPR